MFPPHTEIIKCLWPSPAIFESLPPDNYPLLAGSLAEHAVNPDMDKQFKFGLQVLLDGLAARLKNAIDNG